MKKTVAVLLSAVLLLLCSCSKDNEDSAPTVTEPQVNKSVDMLNITNNGTSYLDCLSRYNAVLSAVKSKVQILENEHNNTIKSADSEKYFLNENYILTFFDPFLLNSFFLTESFDEGMNEEKAKDYYASYSNGADIRYERNSDGTKTLYFTSEDSVKTFCVEYDRNSDSFRFTATTDNDGNKTTDEMLEFVKAGENTYLIQSKTERCYVEFDSLGNIIYFCCTKLKNAVYSNADSIYGKDVSADKNWAISLGKDAYLNIHSFKDDVLTHEECSSGPWKTVAINENDYASAFIF